MSNTSDARYDVPSTGIIGERHSIQGEIERQSYDAYPENFICSHCRNYLGGCSCKCNVFIAFTGANMKNCIYYELERRL